MAETFLITGVSSGFGRALAEAALQDGHRVAGTVRNEADREKFEAIGHGASGLRIDSTNLADLDRLYATIQQRHGRLDVLFANAGGGSMLPLGAITEEHYDDTFDRNVKGLLFTVQKAIPLLSQGASVILTGSTAANMGTPAFSVYAASKAAVRSFARNWILDLKDRGVRVNTIVPGPVRTPGLVDLAGPDAAQQQGLLDYLATQVPIGRVGEASEIASAVTFLASDDASFVNGSELFVDGGQAQV